MKNNNSLSKMTTKFFLCWGPSSCPMDCVFTDGGTLTPHQSGDVLNTHG